MLLNTLIDMKELVKKSWKNMTMLEKAVVLTSTGGQLDTEDAERFIDTVVGQDAFLQKVTTLKMYSNTRNIDVFGIATRQFRSAVEATLAATAQTVNFSLTLPRRTLTGVKVILAPDVTYDFLKENIEREAAEAHLMQQIAQAFKNDMLDLSVNGGLDASTFLAINYGWIYLATQDSTVNDADCSALSAINALNKILLGLPEKYAGLKNELAFLCSYKFDNDYRNEISQRQTNLGDNVLLAAPKLTYSGIAVEPVYAWPNNYVMLTTYKNLHIGVQTDMTVEKMLQPRKQVIEYTITAKTDAEYAVGELIVLGANVGVTG